MRKYFVIWNIVFQKPGSNASSAHLLAVWPWRSYNPSKMALIHLKTQGSESIYPQGLFSWAE